MPETNPVRFDPLSIAHVNLYCSELGPSKQFVTDICGIVPVYNEPEINASFFSNGYSHHDLALMQCSTKPLIGADGKVQNTMRMAQKPGLNHLGFEVPDESGLVAAYRRALADPAGCGLVKCLDHGISHSVYLHDPDDILLEFYCDVVDDWREFYRAGADTLITRQWDPLEQEKLSRVVPNRASARVDGASLHPRRFASATLVVSDLDRSLAYYQDVIGMTVLAGDQASGVAVLGGSLRLYDLALVEARDGETIGLNSCAFELEPGFASDDTQARLQEQGLQRAAFYESAFKHSVFVADRDGLVYEFYLRSPIVDAAAAPVRRDLLSPL